ncbi:DUF11 domain-containing protein, partial [Tenacibaculum aestuarii]|uniref:DUF11 domain-containing protein n=1 Tax=Tenacibaculum aestuarii TaxID=362781 RepID=UPI0038B4AB0B
MRENYISINSVKYKLFLFLLISFFCSGVSYSQCTNGSELIDWNQMYNGGSNLNGNYTTTSCDVETILSSTFTDQSPLNLTDTGVESSSRYRVTMGNVTIGDQVVWELTFSSPLILSNFRVEDIDESTSHLDIVKFTADNDGVDVPLSLTNAGGTPTYSVSGQTATGTSNNDIGTSNDGAVLVNSSQSIKRLIITYEAGTSRNIAVAQSIWFSNYSVCCPEEPTLNITKTSSPSGNVNVGDEITYTIQIENTGNVTADNVDLTDILPSDVTYVNNSITRQYYVDIVNSINDTFSYDFGVPYSFISSGAQSYTVTASDIPHADATFTSFSFEVEGRTPQRNGNHDDDWVSQIWLEFYFPGYVYPIDNTFGSGFNSLEPFLLTESNRLDTDDDEFGGDYSGNWDVVSRNTNSVSGTVFGEYSINWYDDVTEGGSLANVVTKAEFIIGYQYKTYTRTQINDTNGTVANLITSSEGIDIQPGETVTVTFRATVNSNTECNTLTNTATINATNLATALSDTAVNTVNPPLAGTVSSDQTICEGDSPLALTISGHTGDVQWQSSTDNSTFSNISGATGTSYSPGILSSTTYYRAEITSGSCSSSVQSNVVTITITPAPNAGSNGTLTVCQGTTPTDAELFAALGGTPDA